MLGCTTMVFSEKEVETVKDIDIDIDKYMGDWHQVATTLPWFQKKCIKNTKANYERVRSEIKVTNSCTKKDGTKNIAHGRARLNNKFNEASKLQVTFVKIFRKWFWLFGGDYWIMDIDKEYSYSVVGDPKRKYFWILSRKPLMSLPMFQKLEKRIRNQGYDTCKIKITQEGELKGRGLCSLSKPKTKKEKK